MLEAASHCPKNSSRDYLELSVRLCSSSFNNRFRWEHTKLQVLLFTEAFRLGDPPINHGEPI